MLSHKTYNKALRRIWQKIAIGVNQTSGFVENRAHHFHPGTLNNDKIVIDLGCHRGEFASFIAKKYSCPILGVEANPELFVTLPKLPRTEYLNVAISCNDKPLKFFISITPEASSIFQDLAQSTGSISENIVDGVTLDTLLESKKINKVGLLKVDIESAEFGMLELIKDETLSKIAQITVEFHIVKNPSSQFSMDRIKKICRRMKQAGFKSFVMDHNGCDVLFLNPKTIPWILTERFAMSLHSIFLTPLRLYYLSKK